MVLPVEVADLTPTTMTDLLRVGGQDVTVRAVDVLDAHSGTTGRVRLRLGYEGDPDLPATMFVKLEPFVVEQRAFVRAGGIGVNEARLYRDLEPELPMRIPCVYAAAVDDGGGGYVTVMEDLVASGCTFPRPTDVAIAEHARSTVDGLAALHARYWESDRFRGDLAWIPERAGFGADGGRSERSIRGAGHFVRGALESFGAEQAPEFLAVGRTYVSRTAEVLDAWDEGPRTLVHGDPHSGNLFLDGARIGFLDWGMVSRSPGMRDVAYHLCNSLPRDVRIALEDELLERYRTVLQRAGVVLDRDTAWEQYRLFSVFAWVSAVSTVAVGDRWQPSARAVAAMDRTTQALIDLDAAGCLADRLGES
ncbi:MAG: phosphotransferase family protein [Acidimicrobiia bacterium]